MKNEIKELRESIVKIGSELINLYTIRLMMHPNTVTKAQ